MLSGGFFGMIRRRSGAWPKCGGARAGASLSLYGSSLVSEV